MLASKFCSYSCQVIPSTPIAADFFRLKNASVKQSSLTWCIKAVNLSLLSLRAASRTPYKPRDLRLVRLGVRGKAACLAFLLAEPLSSLDSSDCSAHSLFVEVAGIIGSSDFLLVFISAVPSVTFSDRSISK